MKSVTTILLTESPGCRICKKPAFLKIGDTIPDPLCRACATILRDELTRLLRQNPLGHVAVREKGK